MCSLSSPLSHAEGRMTVIPGGQENIFVIKRCFDKLVFLLEPLRWPDWVQAGRWSSRCPTTSPPSSSMSNGCCSSPAAER